MKFNDKKNPKILNIRKPIKTYIVILMVAVTINSTSQSLFAQEIKEIASMIDKSVDSGFVYNYHQAKFVPPHGKTLLIMGQTEETILEYLYNFPNQKMPSGWSAYWGISEFKGITETHKNFTGNSQNHQMIVDKFPNTVVQSAMWMVGKWDISKNAGIGEYDDVVKKYSAWAKSVNRPIYLRIGYEFDGPHNELEPDEYVKAYKHIVDLMRAEGADNIAFVWHSYASKPYKNHPLSAWYPGDEYVDWVAISVFGHAYSGTDFGPYCNHALEFAKEHKKPVMIAEASPIKGIEKGNNEVWNQWFANFFTFTYSKNIKAISFINENWPKVGIEGISEWKDSRLNNNEEVSKAWFKEINEDRYLKQSPELFEQLAYTNFEITSTDGIIEDEKMESSEYTVPKVSLPFYVYQDGDNNPYFPSAYMGNLKAISVDLKSTEDAHSGTSSLKISYADYYDWYGLGLVTPANDWGDIQSGYDLTGATQFSFWAKASQNKLTATIGFGLIGKDKPFPDSAKESIEIKLTAKWKKYTIKLKKQDLSCIRSGFVITSRAYGLPHDIYIDEVVFE